jgi:hypothetical protein
VLTGAPVIYKTLRSSSPRRSRRGELLHVIVGITHEGIIVSAKRAIED